MKRTFLLGLSLAVIGGVGLFIGSSLLGISLQGTVMAIGGGFIIAVVDIGSPLARLGGFLIGYVLGILFDAMYLGLLPGGQSIVGSSVALAIVLLIITLVSGLTSNRIPGWSMIIGTLVFIAGFSGVTQSAPWTASTQLSTYFFSMLAMALLGFLVVVPASFLPEKESDKWMEPSHLAPPPPPAETPDSNVAVETPTPLNDILGGAK